MKTRYLILLLLFLPLFSEAQIELQLELLSNGFTQPVDITNAGDERLFVVEKGGRIRILHHDGTINPIPFLDIDSIVRSTESERGLLGLAFHPGYAGNGYFFVNFTNNDGNTVVARYQVSDGDADLADATSKKVLFTVNQPYANHNGGDLNFGPDGYLYIALGDGGSGGDPQNSGQTGQSILGKMLRIDVDTGDPYGIPPDNPFAETDEILDEVWALGLRNPWRFSFDRLTGDLWIGDVGQSSWEEIDFQPATSTGGENYGWRCYEGDASFNLSDCGEASNYIFPVISYESNLPSGCSVNGGFVYRGATFPLLYGQYLYSDYCSGKIWALKKNEADVWENIELHDGPNSRYVSMGEDYLGELFLVHIDGEILQVRDQTTGTKDQLLNAQLRISPNPFDKNIWVEGQLPESGAYRQQLISASGQVVWENTSYLESDFRKKIVTADLPKGIYFFQLDRNGKKQVIRLIKQ